MVGDRLVAGDGFAGIGVDEKELLLDSDCGIAGHRSSNIDPARRRYLTTGRIARWLHVGCPPVGRQVWRLGIARSWSPPNIFAGKISQCLRSRSDQGLPVRCRPAAGANRCHQCRTRPVGPRTLASTFCTCPITSARPAPFPTLMAAAAATKTLRVGTFVLNACFYKPALLARDVQALRDLSGGRFELGLGAGYAQDEFEAAELPYPSARQRVDYLAPRDRVHGRAPARCADPDRGQRRPAADGGGAAGRHHRADRRAADHRRRQIRSPTGSLSCAARQATASTISS